MTIRFLKIAIVLEKEKNKSTGFLKILITKIIAT